MLQYLHMFAGGGLADAQLSGNKYAADPVLDEVAVNLGREMFPRLFQPVEDFESSGTGERGKHGYKIHIDN